jgi:hypothetical protein
MGMIKDITQLKFALHDIIWKMPVFDIHTHCFSPEFGKLLLWGPDEIITYHYLIAESLRYNSIPYEKFWRLSKKQQADFIWKTLFVGRSPISESCRGILTVFKRLGIDTSKKKFDDIRRQFKYKDVEKYIDVVFKQSNVYSIIMTNDPFDGEERKVWLSKGRINNKRFVPSIRLDCLLNNSNTALRLLSKWGYKVNVDIDERTIKQVSDFLEEWIQRINPVYVAVSLPPSFKFPDVSARGKIIEECVLPICRKYNIPFAMMIGVRRLVNPALKLAGDSVGRSNIEAVENICANHPENKFLLTILAREDQHSCCVVARNFRNLHIFGCWWFLNNSSIIEEMTRMRIELLGTSFTFQHSDARIMDQLLYKWEHSKIILEKILLDKYSDLIKTDWVLTKDQIKTDVSELLGGSFNSFLRY